MNGLRAFVAPLAPAFDAVIVPVIVLVVFVWLLGGVFLPAALDVLCHLP